MDDRTLYAMPGIAAPWEAERVELDDDAKVVHLWLETDDPRGGCHSPPPREHSHLSRPSHQENAATEGLIAKIR